VVSEQGPKATHGDSLQEKKDAGNAESTPKPDGEAIKHAWFWPRMGEWFQDTGECDGDGAIFTMGHS
jgi:pyruvate decarboxylase